MAPAACSSRLSGANEPSETPVSTAANCWRRRGSGKGSPRLAVRAAENGKLPRFDPGEGPIQAGRVPARLPYDGNPGGGFQKVEMRGLRIFFPFSCVAAALLKPPWIMRSLNKVGPAERIPSFLPGESAWWVILLDFVILPAACDVPLRARLWRLHMMHHADLFPLLYIKLRTTGLSGINPPLVRLLGPPNFKFSPSSKRSLRSSVRKGFILLAEKNRRTGQETALHGDHDGHQYRSRWRRQRLG